MAKKSNLKAMQKKDAALDKKLGAKDKPTSFMDFIKGKKKK